MKREETGRDGGVSLCVLRTPGFTYEIVFFLALFDWFIVEGCCFMEFCADPRTGRVEIV